MLTQRMTNILQSTALFCAIIALLCLLGWSFAGIYGILWAMALGVVPLYVTLRMHPQLILKMYRARPLVDSDSPEFFSLVAGLAQRAGLPFRPGIFYIPSRVALVFSVGRGERAAIAISEGMLRLLTLREIVGVMAHETSHIGNNDTWIMSFADVISRLTNTISLLGQLLILINLPLFILGDYTLPWLPLILMLVAPLVSALMQLALSRTREFEADRSAAQITGDPAGLASALAKMEEYQYRLSSRRFLPGHHGAEPSLLRTHPATSERIRRLREIEEELREQRSAISFDNGRFPFPPHLPESPVSPRRRWSGLWY
jgi:heat shock protein HtpX